MITVAICTRNRADSLRRALTSLTEMQGLDGLSWELLVIDNGSTDHTGRVVEAFDGLLPVKRVIEPKPGLAHARNRAVDEARGEYIVWTDDDVVVDSGWLSAYASAFREYRDAVVFGGKILTKLVPPSPRWFVEAQSLLFGLLAYRDFGDLPFALSVSKSQIPWGANYAIRMREQATSRYDPDFGASPNHRRVGEETKVIKSILRSGAQGVWVPQSVVHHVIGPERQTLDYVARYYRSWGETVAFEEPYYPAPSLFSVPRWLWRQTAEAYLRYHLYRVTKPPKMWVASLIRFAYLQGMIQHWRKSRALKRYRGLSAMVD